MVVSDSTYLNLREYQRSRLTLRAGLHCHASRIDGIPSMSERLHLGTGSDCFHDPLAVKLAWPDCAATQRGARSGQALRFAAKGRRRGLANYSHGPAGRAMPGCGRSIEQVIRGLTDSDELDLGGSYRARQCQKFSARSLHRRSVAPALRAAASPRSAPIDTFRPCRRAFSADLALPASDFGPVQAAEFRPFKTGRTSRSELLFIRCGRLADFGGLEVLRNATQCGAQTLAMAFNRPQRRSAARFGLGEHLVDTLKFARAR